MLVSNAWSALIRRNLIYRRRNWLSTLSEVLLPLAFCLVLVVLQRLASQSDHFRPKDMPAAFSSDLQTVQMFSFTDYVKALQAQRVCLDKSQHPQDVTTTVMDQFASGLMKGRGGTKQSNHIGTTNATNTTKNISSSNSRGSSLHSSTTKEELAFFLQPNQTNFDISGMPHHGRNWQVPFIQCDSRQCQYHGEPAYAYCHFPKLGLAPSTSTDAGGKERLERFQTYIYNRYPQLQNASLPAFSDGPFIQVFDSNQAIEEYTQHVFYGATRDRPKLALTIVFTGNDPFHYDYTIRVNATHQNAPEWAPGTATHFTTPDTSRLFLHNAKQEIEVCGRHVHGHFQGPLSYSCTGQYILNGLLPLQRFLHDWMFVDSGARDKGYFVAEHGVKFTSFPAPPYVSEGFYSVLNGVVPLFLTLGLLYPCASIMSYLAHERELAQHDFLKMNSVTQWQLESSWWVSFLVLHTITAGLMARVSGPLFAHSDSIILWMFWQSTFLSLIAFSSCIPSIVMQHAGTATRTALIGLLVFLVGYFMSQAVDVQDGSPLSIRLSCLHPVSAFSYGIQELGRLEDAGVGATWTSMVETDSPSGFTLLAAISSMLLDCILWTVVSLYCNRVFASNDDGYVLSYAFPFQRSYWIRGDAATRQQLFQYSAALSEDDDIPMEPVSEALKQQAVRGKSVEIHNLCKTFNTKTGSNITAVDGVNLSLYQGQITALLGPNGCGKSTTIGMLTGAIRPTRGFHVVTGKHSMTQMPEIRQQLGICQQHNDCLFPQLTCREHLEFFHRLRGTYRKMTQQEADERVKQAMRDVALEDKADTQVMHLSGGMKRKLCIAIAFAGDSNVIILDEPTSGMDPFSRRFIWNLIKQYKQDKIILLTTHFLDEADILADKIAILSTGRLRCVGSSLFLKKAYGVGYHLTIEKAANSNDKSSPRSATDIHSYGDQDLKEIVTGSVQEAKLLTNAGKEMSFQLPLESNSKFDAMLRRLDSARLRGAICSYGLNMTTLEEVFQRVTTGDDNHTTTENSPVGSDRLDDEFSDDEELAPDAAESIAQHNQSQVRQQMKALLRKRLISFKRDKKAWCFTTLLPVFFVLIGFLALKYASPNKNFGPLSLKLEDYNLEVDLASVNGNRNPIPYNSPGTFFKCQPGWCSYEYPIVQVTETDEFYFFCGAQSYLLLTPNCSIDYSSAIMDRIKAGGAEAAGESVHNIAEASHKVLESSGIYSASQYGAIYFTYEPNSTTNQISSYGKHAVKQCSNFTGHYMPQQECSNYAGYGYVVAYNFTALHASPLYQKLADEAIMREAFDDNSFRISASVHPLPQTKAESRYSQEDDIFNLWFMVVLSFPFIAGYMGNFVLDERLSKAKHLQAIAGVQSTTYWISTFLWDISNYLLPFSFTVLLLYVFDVDIFMTTERDTIYGVVSLLLFFGPAAASYAYCVSFFFTSASLCNLFIIITGFLTGLGAPIATYMLRLLGSNPEHPWDKLVHAAITIEWIARFTPAFCLGKGLLYTIYIRAFEMRKHQTISVWSKDILLLEIIALFLQGFGYLILAIILDRLQGNQDLNVFLNKFKSFLACRVRIRYQACPTDDTPDDSDVIKEEERVLSGMASNDAVVLQQLRKVYDNEKVAVTDLSLGISSGEAFGLLGTNGAGKTTTMGMLTGEFPPSSGNVLLAGESSPRRAKFFQSAIGYCPQFDALFENLSGREHVELYAHIKGVSAELVPQAADKKLSEVGFNDYDKDRLSQHYSGGMKRKLSIAIATVSSPLVVCLDEPSTGVDPVARREIWRVISTLLSKRNPKTNRKTCVILTTHSMNECESLCSRIGIMKGGKLICLGSAQRLKSKFGRGYQLEFKVNSVETCDDDYVRVRDELFQSTGRSIIGRDVEVGVLDEEMTLGLEQARVALSSLTGTSLTKTITADDPCTSGIYKDACSIHGVSLRTLASWATLELRMETLNTFVYSSYNGAILRERQDTRTRYEVDSSSTVLADIFAGIEANRSSLQLSEYGVTQTSLELVFNTLVADQK